MLLPRPACQVVTVSFVVNGYRLSNLVKDPAAVEFALARLAELLADTRRHMLQLGRHDVADRLDELARELEAAGAAIDDTFDDAFREVTTAAADACENAWGAEDDPNAQAYEALTWCLVDLVVVRIGGFGTIEHSGGSPDEG